jgi:peptidoglycan biosynthesis protein MviN/MurJ (putative lipid II flippase)
MIFSFPRLPSGSGWRQIGPAATLGTGREMDAFLVAVTLHTFLNIVAMSTAVSALVPFFKEELQSSDRLGRAKAFSRIFAAS